MHTALCTLFETNLIFGETKHSFCLLEIIYWFAISWVFNDDDIGSGSVCFDFRATNLVHLSMSSMVA